MSNKLFPISLIGEGTADVESFASYVHRSAKAHGVNVGVPLRYIQIEANKDPEFLSYHQSWVLHSYIRPEELVCPNEHTHNLVNAMSYFSKQSLMAGVLWFLNSVVGRSSGEICHGFRWCPECLSEIEAVEGVAYFKLIWHLKEIECCPIHRTPLVCECPKCGCDQISYVKSVPLNFCQSCGANLAKRRKKLKAEDIKHSWEISGFDILTLFDDLATCKPNSLNPDSVRISLGNLFDYYWSQDREAELFQALPRDKLILVVDGLQSISLKVVRRFAYRMGLSLFDLMSGNVFQATAVDNSSWFCSLPPSFTRASSREKRDHKETLKRIRRYIEKCDAPPSLKQVARQTCVSVGYLEYRYPVLAKKIVNEHSSHQDQEKLIRRYRAQEAALKYFCGLAIHESPSRKRAYKDLRRETLLPKFLLKRAIQTAYVAIYGD